MASISPSRYQEYQDVFQSILKDDTSLQNLIQYWNDLGVDTRYNYIHKLPIEVLVLVFKFHLGQCLSEIIPQRNAELGDHILRSVLIAQNKVLRVCRLWRYSALASPCLWTTVPLMVPAFLTNSGSYDDYVPYPQKPLPDASAYWKFIRDRTALAGDLSLSVYLTPVDFYMDANVVKQFLAYTIELLPQTEHLFLKISATGHSARLPSLSKARPSQRLKSAYIHVQLDETQAQWGAGFFSLMPTIHRLRLNHGTQCLAQSQCASIRELEVNRIDMTDLARILKANPHLQNLRLTNIQLWFPEDITHQALERITFKKTSPPQFLQGLTLPALKHLTLPVSHTERQSAWPSFEDVAFFARSDCALASLDVSQAPVDARIHQIFRSQYHLTKLVLYQDLEVLAGEPTVVQLLKRKPLMLPSLKHLTLKGAPETPTDLAEMLALRVTQSKQEKVAKLKTCSLFVRLGPARLSLKPFLEMKGFSLKIETATRHM
ncbi:hypothetical protein CYLTODRAFT_453912 [Cylindrobasidium torrendii FP15055 ss-10]|uniref:F-box domain-containing protein n=1 Tax=Cylindrobasidium torrendii FP15055 ss-10 TaxID=1314674 RepID=A0A0D7BBY8_9AGAR|nr:hypothetical protein CYLTODRAFT_453912 [Cylindrobasidium torrendii FP15055 ss-10]